jgi:hypothetical protein
MARLVQRSAHAAAPIGAPVKLKSASPLSPTGLNPNSASASGKPQAHPRGGVKLSWINIGWRLDATEATFRTSPDPGWIGRANIKKRPPRSQNFPSPIPVSMDKSAEPTPVL